MNAIEILQEIVRKNAQRTFLIDSMSDTSLSYGDFDGEAKKVAAWLLSRGLKKGERVAIVMNNSLAIAKIYFGCLYAGIVVVPVNPVLSGEHTDFVIRNSAAKLIITSPEFLEKFRGDNAPGRGIGLVCIGTGGDSSEQLDIDRLEESASYKPFQDVGEDDELIIVYTSGTTAAPKGVVHSYADLVHNARLYGGTVGVNSDSRFYNILPMTYLGGYYNLLLLPFANEGSTVLAPAFSPQLALNFWDPAIRYGVNTLWVVPTIISMLLELDRGQAGREYSRENVKLTLAGTAPLHNKVKRDFEERYGVRIFENFALSETLFITTTTPESWSESSAVGRVIPGIEVKLVDNHSNEVAKGEEGEILVKTPYLMQKYYNTEDGVPTIIEKNSWFSTGDVGCFNEQGELFITGRKKDLIIRGGINLSPAAIEEKIYLHPSVAECAVVGLPHKIMGEEIFAVVRLAENSDFEKVKGELKELCKNSLAQIQQPSQFIELPEFPHTSSGKIQKVKIRAWLAGKFEGREDTKARKSVSRKEATEKFFQPSRVVGDSIQAISIKYNNMVYEMQHRGDDVTVLSLGEAFFDIPLYRFDDLPFPNIYHYCHSRGIPELRAKLAEYFLDHYDVAFDPEKEVLLTAGSKIAIHMALMAVLNPGDECIIHEPAWVSYPEQVKLCYGVPVQIPYHVSVFEFEQYITNRTKIIIINSPNNPTGKVFTLEELSHLYSLAEKYNLYILSDEAYSDFLLENEQFISIGNLDQEKKHLILVNSISKNYGISGWRLGYIITNAELINQLLKLNQHMITCAPTILQYYIEKHFDDIIRITKPQIRNLVRKRQEIAAYMDELGLGYLSGTATFYFFVSIEGTSLSSEEFCTRLLEEQHISTVPGIGYGKSCGQFIRVSVGTESMERIKKALNAIKDFIEQTKEVPQAELAVQ